MNVQIGPAAQLATRSAGIHNAHQGCCKPRKVSSEHLPFNLLTANVDDQLHDLGLLHAGKGQRQLAHVVGLKVSQALSPSPDQDGESKPWLSEDTGAITSIDDHLKQADYFRLNQAQVRQVLRELVETVDAWRTAGAGPQRGLSVSELDEFALAF